MSDQRIYVLKPSPGTVHVSRSTLSDVLEELRQLPPIYYEHEPTPDKWYVEIRLGQRTLKTIRPLTIAQWWRKYNRTMN